MFTTQKELTAAFIAAYPQHDTSEHTEESSIDWADWFEAQDRAGLVHSSLFEE